MDLHFILRAFNFPLSVVWSGMKKKESKKNFYYNFFMEIGENLFYYFIVVILTFFSLLFCQQKHLKFRGRKKLEMLKEENKK